MAAFDKASLKTEGFRWQSALNLALASKLAYQDADPASSEALTQWGFDEFAFFDKDTTQGFITWDADIVLVSFRGTQELGDWLTNLDLDRTKRDYGKLHEGFFLGYEVVASRIKKILKSAAPAGKKVWITGHSLGGALATVMGAELRDTLSITGFYTYGQPKCCNRKVRNLFRERYPNVYFRFVNDDDVVPKIPPTYRHVGELYWFDAAGELQERPPGFVSMAANGDDEFGPHELTEDEFKDMQAKFSGFESVINMEQKSGADLVPEAIPAPGFEVQGIFPSVRDHKISRYIEKIQNQLTALG